MLAAQFVASGHAALGSVESAFFSRLARIGTSESLQNGVFGKVHAARLPITHPLVAKTRTIESRRLQNRVLVHFSAARTAQHVTQLGRKDGSDPFALDFAIARRDWTE